MEDLKNNYIEKMLNKHLKETSLSDVITRVCETVDLKPAKYLKDIVENSLYLPASTIMINSSSVKTAKRDIHNCYLYSVEDDINSIAQTYRDVCLLTANGGGIGLDVSKLSGRAKHVSTHGIIPFILAFASVVSSTKQTDRNNGNVCFYCDINHPEITDFINIHNYKSGGDLNSKRPDVFNAVKINDEFMESLKSGNEKSIELITEILRLRFETGRPFIYFSDNVNRGKCPTYQDKHVTMSNLCTEILVETTDNKASLCTLASINFKTIMKLTPQQRTVALKHLVTLMKRVYSQSEHKNTIEFKNEVVPKNFDGSIGIGIFGYIDRVEELGLVFDDEIVKTELCNLLDEVNALGTEAGFSQVTAIAPTENISRVFGASQGLDYYTSKEFVNKDYGKQQIYNVNHKHTAYDFAQSRRLEFVGEIQKHVHQGISTSLFYKNDVTMQEMMQDLVIAWKAGVKTLYYVKVENYRKPNDVYERNDSMIQTRSNVTAVNHTADYSIPDGHLIIKPSTCVQMKAFKGDNKPNCGGCGG